MMGDNWDAGMDIPGGMSNVTPLHSQETPIGALRNSLMIAELWASGAPEEHWVRTAGAFGDITRLIRHVIEGLSEPSLPAVQAAATMIREAYNGHEPLDEQRAARDLASVILRAAVTGQIPKTWSEP